MLHVTSLRETIWSSLQERIEPAGTRLSFKKKSFLQMLSKFFLNHAEFVEQKFFKLLQIVPLYLRFLSSFALSSTLLIPVLPKLV